MSSARWVWVLGLLGASGCGGIPIVSGDPFVADASPRADVGADADASSTTDLGRDAASIDLPDAMDVTDVPDVMDVTDAMDVTDVPDVMDVTDVPDAMDVTDVPDAMDAPDATDVGRIMLDVMLAEVARPDAFVSEAGMTSDVGAAFDDLGFPCALCLPGSGSAQVCCNARCRDLRSDPSNCGGCGVVCPATYDCVGGACRSTICSMGLELCGGACFDLRTSSLHCGRCDNPCPAGQPCRQGACLPPIDAGSPDAVTFDLGTPDSPVIDTPVFDAGTPDTFVPDVAFFETFVLDLSPPVVGADVGVE